VSLRFFYREDAAKVRYPVAAVPFSFVERLISAADALIDCFTLMIFANADAHSDMKAMIMEWHLKRFNCVSYSDDAPPFVL